MEEIKFGIIGCGLMGREFVSAASRWCHLLEMDVKPVIKGVCDVNIEATKWFNDHLASVEIVTDNYKELLQSDEIDAIYCAVPHHLHADIYVEIIESGKHLLGEKPFGIDQQANKRILNAIEQNEDIIVRCSSEIPYFPGAYKLFEFINNGNLGDIINVEVGFWHSSDLNPHKTINWKRQVKTNGEYGCMGDLGMHVLHLPLRLGWKPKSVRALLSNLVKERPDKNGELVPCDTWDNAILTCEIDKDSSSFPMIVSTKRIAPGHNNTWFIKAEGMEGSVEFSTQNPKILKVMNYQAGGSQEWRHIEVPYDTAYKTITGPIFEFGFSDSILQMWAAFCDEIHNRNNMKQPLYCVTPEETATSHEVFSSALESQKTGETVTLDHKKASV